MGVQLHCRCGPWLHLPEPIISKLHNGKWGVILANGYNSTNDRAALFILDAVDGTVTRKFTVGTAGTINGLSRRGL